MTPAARLSAAIGILDDVFRGEVAERVLTRWARSSRFAGSKDRAAVRDLVFEGLRCRLSHGWLGGGATGRAVILGGQIAGGHPLDDLFTGEGFAPPALTDSERAALGRDLADAPDHVRYDVPEDLLPVFEASLGDSTADVLLAMRQRAPVDLRVNRLKTNVDAAIVVLVRDGIHVSPVSGVAAALRVLENPRLVASSRAYTQGMIELQDISSQQAAAFARAQPGEVVLDYCAGGGGKTLALAMHMRGEGRLLAWDANERRMGDLATRARRAGIDVTILTRKALGDLGSSCDLVYVDAPCSGTGAWRRTPDAKWRIDRRRLAEFPTLQLEILNQAKSHLRSGGRLVYATCSLLAEEDEQVVAAFLDQNAGWSCARMQKLTPLDGGDGFFMAELSSGH